VDITILPPWFEGLDELARISPSRPEGNIILFVGAMDILANQEAAIYFAREILPQVRDRLTDAEFYVVGNKPGPQVERLAIIDGVIVTGEVEALRPYYEKAAVNVVPLMTGGGIIVKTLNGMASGRPTIVSEAGNSGTEALNDEHLLVVTDGAEAFSDAVVKVLIDDKLWTRLAISGQSFIQNRYDWNTIIKDLEILIQKIAQ
jgi:glycosyltransferase involved in cell wall biosynthesis